MMPQPRRWSRATLPNSPLSLQETDVIEVVRQLRTAANAVAIRTPILSYCESFAIANSLRFCCGMGHGPPPSSIAGKFLRRKAAFVRLMGGLHGRRSRGCRTY